MKASWGVVLSGIAVLALSSGARAQADFRPHKVVASLPSVPHSVLAADVNGDGRDDVIVSITTGVVADAQNDHRLLVFLQRGDGVLAAPIKVAAGLSGTFARLVSADMNADGVQDIVVVHGNGVSVVLGSPTAAFIATQTGWGDNNYRTDAGSLVVVDANRDGHADVVATAALGYGGDFWIFQGDGTGALTAATQPIATPGFYIGSGRLYAGDLNSDGNQDLVISAGHVFVVLHDGDAGFVMPERGLDGYEAAVGDFNADGRDDLATFLAGPPRSQFYVQGATGALAYARQIGLTRDVDPPVVRDMDGDGDDDLITRSPDGSTIGYYDQENGLAHERDYSVPGSAVAYDAGDIDDDGYMDIVVIGPSGLGILRGRSSRDGLTEGNDFNGDGYSDLLWRQVSTGRNTIWNSASSGTQTAVFNWGTEWFVAGTHDFDGDGRTDVFWRNGKTGKNDIWRSADGRFVEGITAVIDQGWKVAGTGDFDGDGRADILWRHATRGHNVVWRSGHSATQLAVAAVTNLAWTVAAVGDFDGDGRSDIFWRNGQSGVNVIWRSGNTTTQTSVMAVTDTRWEVVGAGDFNGDGRDDVLWRHREWGRNAAWLSGNAGTQLAVMGVTNLAWKVAEIGDFDGDGRSDVVWRNTQSGANAIWKAADYYNPQSVLGVTDQAWRIAR